MFGSERFVFNRGGLSAPDGVRAWGFNCLCGDPPSFIVTPFRFQIRCENPRCVTKPKTPKAASAGMAVAFWKHLLHGASAPETDEHPATDGPTGNTGRERATSPMQPNDGAER